MKRLVKESQVWSHLADIYESRTSSGQSICLAIEALWADSSISVLVHDSCIARLKKRFKPRWWNLSRRLNMPYYWPRGFSPPRAAACDELFYESLYEEMDVSRQFHTLALPVSDELFYYGGVGGLL